MGLLIAAIDESAAARPVLATALEIAQLIGDRLVALTVCDDRPRQTTTDVAAACDVALHVCRGDPIAEITAAAAGDDVDGVVVGSRGLPSARRAVGHTALALIQALDKPVVVVPPTANAEPGHLHRLLVPLDGTAATAAAVEAFLRRVRLTPEFDVVALHVFEADEIPSFSDHAGHETAMWEGEFLQRWLPDHHRDVAIETRVGRAGEAVRAVVRDVGADLVVVAWKQDLSPGRADVISALLADGDIPIVMLPAGDRPEPRGRPPADEQRVGGP